eukprot:gb/GFBE01062828.1/.p1 GENE.gb/GFBE01062828.1/~~gb/GFBE01062828.1/.p1  ORF type:complete len:284 (+),score=60.52 gb/GFBE01062828.1/:1-852(+)
MSGFFRGTSTDQVKHVNAEQKLIKEMTKNKRFPDHFAQKVDMSKVSMDVMKPWIAKRITEMLGFEDDIVVDFCVNSLLEPGEKGLDPKMLQVNLTGFMERKAPLFCSELWKHLLSAQESPVGVPREFIDQKKDELRQKREEAEKVQEELKRRKADLEDASKTERDAARERSRSRKREEPVESRRSQRDDDRDDRRDDRGGRGRDRDDRDDRRGGRDDRGRDDRRGRDRDDDRRGGRGREDDRRGGRGREDRRRGGRDESSSESPQPRGRRGGGDRNKRFEWED